MGNTLQVRKRNGDVVDFDSSRIYNAVLAAFKSNNIKDCNDAVEKITDIVTDNVRKLGLDIVDIETIQDLVEATLLENRYHNVAKSYILYRSEHEELRKKLHYTMEDGSKLPYKQVIKDLIRFTDGIPGADYKDIVNELSIQLYDGVTEKELENMILLVSRSFMVLKPEYDKVTARAHIYFTKKEIYKTLQLPDNHTIKDYITAYLEAALKDNLLSREVVETYTSNIDQLASFYDDQRDDLLTYLSVKTLTDRYLIRNRKKEIIETPQMLFLRVSMGLFYKEDDPIAWVGDFYDKISTLHYMPSTPTLFNSATIRQQLSSCYLTTVEDSLDGIFDALKEDARLSKYAGGIANDWTPVRALGAHIHGTNGESQGIIPFLKLVNDTALAVNQCFYPGIYIDTNTGFKKIEDVEPGDYVVNFDGKYDKVVEVLKYPIDHNQSYCLIEALGKQPIVVSEDHPLCVLDSDGNYVWLEASKIKPRMKLVLRRQIDGNTTYDGILESDFIIMVKLYFSLLSKQYGFPEDIFQDQYESLLERLKSVFGFIDKAVLETDLTPSQSRRLVRAFRKVAKELSGSDNMYYFTSTLEDYMLINKYEHTAGLKDKYLSWIVRPYYIDGVYIIAMPIEYEFDDDIKHYTSIVTSVEKIKPTFDHIYDLKVDSVPSYNTATVTAHNGGKRRGSICCYLEIWHADILDFIDLKKNTGDERRRTHDMNTACWIPDYFMEVLESDGTWYLFSPDEVPELHELTGMDFKEKYQYYVELGKKGKLRIFKEIPAFELWRKLITSLYETGHPWITFKDISNHRYTNKHIGTVKSSNLCTEILIHTSDKETAVCNLGSIVLTNHIKPDIDPSNLPLDDCGAPLLDSFLDTEKLAETIRIAVRGLDNVIDINFYPSEKAEYSNLRNRPIGLGLMGFQDLLQILEIPYDTSIAAEIADRIQEFISYHAIDASIDLAREKGVYKTYSGSLWDLGKLPIDTIDIAEQERGEFILIDRNQYLPWDIIRDKLNKYGIRNSLLMAIAPTATIGNICGVSPSIEPTYQNLYVKSNLSGEFVIYNRILVDKLKQLGIWSDTLARKLIENDGSVQNIPEIPANLKDVFKTAFEIDQKFLIDCAAKRQKWIDQSQSLNLYVKHPTGKYLSDLYKYAFKKGLKTTYYLRAIAATKVESVVDSQPDTPKVCSIDNPDCEACQ